MTLIRRSKAPGCPRLSGSAYSVLDLLAALAIMGILLALAVPSYQRYAQRGYRAEAVRLLMAAAACEERIRASTGFYDTSRCGDNAASDHYAIRIEPSGEIAATEFTVVAEPLRAAANDPCGTLTLDQAGTRGIAGEASVLADCWGGR